MKMADNGGGGEVGFMWVWQIWKKLLLYRQANLSSSLHNTFVLIVTCFLTLWFLKILYKILITLDLFKRLRNQEALYFEGMASYRDDLMRLFHPHFNQILRAKRTVPPITLPCVYLSVSVHASSVKLIQRKNVGNNDKDGGKCLRNKGNKKREGGEKMLIDEEKYGLIFNFDSTKACIFQIFFGVSLKHFHQMLGISDCSQGNLVVRVENRFQFLNFFSRFFSNGSRMPSDASRALLEMEEIDCSSSPVSRDSMYLNSSHYVSKTNEYVFDAGMNQTFFTKPEDEFCFESFMKDSEKCTSNVEIIPILIIATAIKGKEKEYGTLGALPISDGYCELTVLAKTSNSNGGVSIEVLKQICICNNNLGAIEGFDIYGLEDENDKDCLICMCNLKDTMLLPCRHSSLCFDCLRSLRQEKCPICRATFTSFVIFPFKQQFNRATGSSDPPGLLSLYENDEKFKSTHRNRNNLPTISTSVIPSSSTAISALLFSDSNNNDEYTQGTSYNNFVHQLRQYVNFDEIDGGEREEVVSERGEGGNLPQVLRNSENILTTNNNKTDSREPLLNQPDDFSNNPDA